MVICVCAWLQKPNLWMGKGSPIRVQRERQQERTSLKGARAVKRERESHIGLVRAREVKTE